MLFEHNYYHPPSVRPSSSSHQPAVGRVHRRPLYLAPAAEQTPSAANRRASFVKRDDEQLLDTGKKNRVHHTYCGLLDFFTGNPRSISALCFHTRKALIGVSQTTVRHAVRAELSYPSSKHPQQSDGTARAQMAPTTMRDHKRKVQAGGSPIARGQRASETPRRRLAPRLDLPSSRPFFRVAAASSHQVFAKRPSRSKKKRNQRNGYDGERTNSADCYSRLTQSPLPPLSLVRVQTPPQWRRRSTNLNQRRPVIQHETLLEAEDDQSSRAAQAISGVGV